MAALRFHQRRVRRWWITGLTLTAFTLFAVVFVTASSADNASGCDFAATGTTESCSGPLSGSTFAGGDGNLLTNPTTFGTTDWQNVAGLNKGIDLGSGSGDNSFGQGTKEDDANVTVVSGSIPPNKSDLTRFYEASEFANGSNFLYLAWERTNVLGSANMDFEINQATTANLGAAGPHTINRTAGDLLVTFDFNNGGGRPALGLNFWVTTGSTSQCLSSNKLPCWGNHVNLNSTNSIGAVNNLDAVTDPIAPDAPRSLSALTFGEAAINLTAAGVFPTGTCEAFGSVFLKSRASASFPAEVKDFVAPIAVNISNCGRIKIRKVTNPAGGTGFNYTTTGSSPLGGGFSLDDGGLKDFQNVPAGSYSVTESAKTGWDFTSLVCTDSGGASHTISGATANITMVPNGLEDCTYTNTEQLGAIKITKRTSKSAHTGLQGATFSITKDGSPITGSPFTSGNDGTICVDNLAFGDYVVTETSPPSGYNNDDPNPHTVTVGTSSSCPNTGIPASQQLTFDDTPLTNITATATSQAVGGTQSTISCVDSGNANVGNSPQGPLASPSVSATDLMPGTYTCTIVVDP
jgi:hypothetical protein